MYTQAQLDTDIAAKSNNVIATANVVPNSRQGDDITSGQYEGISEYIANQSITLLPGFTVNAGTTFTARIGAISSVTDEAFPGPAYTTYTGKSEALVYSYYDNYNYGVLTKSFVPENGLTQTSKNNPGKGPDNRSKSKTTRHY